MKTILGLTTALALVVSRVSGHYEFNKIAVAGKQYGVYEGVRQHVNKNSPVTDLASKDLVCNKGAISGANTIVIPAKAGDSFTFGTDTVFGAPVYHNGPISLFLSKSTGPVQEYDGSNGFVKIQDFGPTFGSSVTWPNRATYTGTIPKCVMNGEYLLRIQSIGIHNPYPAGLPQFYISCAQLNISGGTGTTASWGQTAVKIPGVFKATDPGYVVNIYNPGFKSYDVPGGPVFSGC